MAKVITEMNPKPMKLKFEKVGIQLNNVFKTNARSYISLTKKDTL